MAILIPSRVMVKGLILRMAATGAIETRRTCTPMATIKIIRKNLLLKKFWNGFHSLGRSFLALIKLKSWSIT